MRVNALLFACAGASAVLASCADSGESRLDATPIASTATAAATGTPRVIEMPAPAAPAAPTSSPAPATPLPAPTAEIVPALIPTAEARVAPAPPTPPVTTPASTPVAPIRIEPPPAVPQSPQVRWSAIRDLDFTEPVIEVSVGSTVVWTNLDGIAHTVTSADSMLDSPFLSTGHTYAMTFPRAGVFAYFCRPHLQMTGTVVVRE